MLARIGKYPCDLLVGAEHAKSCQWSLHRSCFELSADRQCLNAVAALSPARRITLACNHIAISFSVRGRSRLRKRLRGHCASSSLTRAMPAWRIPSASAATFETSMISASGVRASILDRNDDIATVIEIVDAHVRSKRQREMRSDQAGMIGTVIIGRNAELIGQGARRSESGAERHKDRKLQCRLLVRDLPRWSRIQAWARASSQRGLRRHRSVQTRIGFYSVASRSSDLWLRQPVSLVGLSQDGGNQP